MFNRLKKMETQSLAHGRACVARSKAARSRTRTLVAAGWLAGAVLVGQQPDAPPQAAAQVNPTPIESQEENLLDFRGPGIPNPGIGDIGARGGDRNQLRYHAGANFIWDNSLLPDTLSASGQLVPAKDVIGGELSWGVYGVHSSRRYQLALDYMGDYHQYDTGGIYNGSDQGLRLGFTVRASRRVAFDFRQGLGSYRFGNSLIATSLSSDPNSPVTPDAKLLDDREYYVQSAGYLTYILSARSTFTVGGQGIFQELKTPTVSKGYGYTLTGSYQRRITRSVSAGFNYSYADYEFAAGTSGSATNSVRATYAQGFGHNWTLAVQAGVSRSKIHSIVVVPLTPEAAVVYGFTSFRVPLQQTTYSPDGMLELRRKFARSSLGISYLTGVASEFLLNGTTKRQSGQIGYSYFANRRTSFGLTGGYYGTKVIGQAATAYYQISGNASVSYLLARGMYLNANYMLRDQQVNVSGYKRNGSRVTVGVTFSPGKLPFSPW